MCCSATIRFDPASRATNQYAHAILHADVNRHTDIYHYINRYPDADIYQYANRHPDADKYEHTNGYARS